MKFRCVTLVVALFAGVLPICAQTTPAVSPRDVTFCELSRDPAAFNHQIVRLTGFVTHGFEDFGVSDPECGTQGFGIWLMYGGKTESNTMYCCPGEGSRAARPNLLKAEDIEIPLVEDQIFQSFTALLKKEADSTVRATLVGRFFSGDKVMGGTEGTQAFWRGYGHMGCCSLLAIQQV